MPDNNFNLNEALAAEVTVLSDLVSAFVEQSLRADGLGLGTFELLSAVKATAGKATQAQIAARLGITPPSLCEAVRNAVQRGLIEQRPVETDRRAKRVVLTPKGEAVLAKTLRYLEAAQKYLSQGISDEEMTVALEVVRRASGNLAKALEVERRTAVT